MKRISLNTIQSIPSPTSPTSFPGRPGMSRMSRMSKTLGSMTSLPPPKPNQNPYTAVASNPKPSKTTVGKSSSEMSSKMSTGFS